MYYLIPLFIILAAVGVIFYIVAKKFTKLANLDVENLPMEKESRKKREIISKRIEAEVIKAKEKWRARLEPLRKIWGLLQLRFRVYVGKVERLWHHEQMLKKKISKKSRPDAKAEDEAKLNSLIQEAEQYLKNGSFEQAENLFIAAVKINQKSAPAYRGLGDTYLAKGAVEESKQTYKFLLQLDPRDDSVMVRLAEIAENENNLEEAIKYYQQAVMVNDVLSPRFYHLAELLVKAGQPKVALESIIQAVDLEPKNPKYLDLLMEIAIICGDKPLALKGYSELRLVNPDNQKLVDFKDRIDKM